MNHSATEPPQILVDVVVKVKVIFSIWISVNKVQCQGLGEG